MYVELFANGPKTEADAVPADDVSIRCLAIWAVHLGHLLTFIKNIPQPITDCGI